MADESPPAAPNALFSDLPIEGDEGLAFRFDGLARTLAELAQNPGNRAPFTVVVRGGWGRGKTTLLRQTRRLLDADREAGPQPGRRTVWTLWFNAWKYPGEDSVLAGLLGALLDDFRRGGALDQLTHLVDAKKGRIAMALLRWAAPWLPDELGLGDEGSRYSEGEARRAFYDTFRTLFAELWLVRQQRKAALLDTQHRPVEETLAERQSEAALAIFLDDLDRCRDERVYEVLEAINLFLDLPGVCFFLGLDWERLSAVLRARMQGREEAFLEKIVQVSFDLPEISPTDTVAYVWDLVSGSSLETLLRRSEDGEGLDDAVALAATVQSRHPRHVKRVLNDLSIRLSVLGNTGLLGNSEGQIPERAVLAWHLLHEELPRGEWDAIRALPANLDAWLRRWRALEERADDQDQPDGVSESVTEMHRRGHLTAHVQTLAALSTAQRHTLLYLGSPPRERTVRSQPAERSATSGRGLDLTRLDGEAWVALPGGAFRMGADDLADARPVHAVTLSPFRITRFPVTNLQYREFVEATGKAPPRHWEEGRIPEGKEHHPVVHVSWLDAEAFCTWLTRSLGDEADANAQLPTEAQWEYAARGEAGRTYPWGDEEPTKEHANFDDAVGDTSPLDGYPRGATPEGIQDLAGNVWEWCRDWYGAYGAAGVRDPSGPKGGSSRVLRGGAWDHEAQLLRAACRGCVHPELRVDVVGFRVVWSSAGGQDLL